MYSRVDGEGEMALIPGRQLSAFGEGDGVFSSGLVLRREWIMSGCQIT